MPLFYDRANDASLNYVGVYIYIWKGILSWSAGASRLL